MPEKNEAITLEVLQERRKQMGQVVTNLEGQVGKLANDLETSKELMNKNAGALQYIDMMIQELGGGQQQPQAEAVEAPEGLPAVEDEAEDTPKKKRAPRKKKVEVEEAEEAEEISEEEL